MTDPTGNALIARIKELEEALKKIKNLNIIPSTGASIAMAMRRIAEEALNK